MQMHLVYFSRRTLARCCAARASTSSTSAPTPAASALSYLASRLDAYVPPLAPLVGAVLQRVGLGERTVGVKLGDIFTVIARKPTEA